MSSGLDTLTRDNLPDLAKAKLPKVYVAAKTALAQCSQVDECRDWANKAEAIASYAKQAEDDELRKLADRIQARAIRRCGELLRQIPAMRKGRPKVGGAPPPLSRSSAARDAGMSRDQKRTALRVAGIPEPEFEEAVESPRPPSVTALAERGKRSSLIDLKGRDPAEFRLATQALGDLSRLVEFAKGADPAAVARGAFPRERQKMRRHVAVLIRWLRQLNVRLAKEKSP